MKVTVTMGQIVINTIDLWIDDPRAKVLIADCKTKRCDYSSISGEGENGHRHEIRFVKAPETMNAAETDEPTVVEISGLGEHWELEVVAARYSIHFFLWEVDPERRFIGDPLFERTDRSEP